MTIQVTSNDILFAAGDFTCGLLDSVVSESELEFFAKYSASLINTCGKDVIAGIAPSDRPGVFVPIDVWTDGKWELGCILTLQDRAMVVWYTGTFRTRTFTQVVLYQGISNVTEAAIEPAKGHRQISERVTLRVEGEQPITMRVPRFKNSSVLDMMVRGALLGTVTFAHET